MFANGFDAIANAIFDTTQVSIGFVLDATIRPVIFGQPAFVNDYYPTSAYPACSADAGAALLMQRSLLAIQAYAPEGTLSPERSEVERVDLKRRYLANWAATGIPVFMDLTIGYDGHLVFQPGPHMQSGIWGNNASWRVELLRIQPRAFPGSAFTTWNGYTEGYAVVPTTEFGQSAFRWVQRITRQWFDILPGLDFSGNTVTALWQTSPFYLRLFVTDVVGSVWMTWWEPGREWTFWSVPLAPELQVQMHPGAEVTAVWRQQNQHFDLFVTGKDGAVWSLWWDGDWRPEGWLLVHPEIKMFPGATVTAVWATNEGDHLDLFVTGTDGAVWTIWWDNFVGWRPEGWIELHPEIKMQPGANVTAVWASPGEHLDLFITGTDGAVWTIWWDNVVGWRPEGWIALHPEIKMKPGATVTAVWTISGEHLDLFATDSSGVVWSTWHDAAGWRPEGWFVIGDSFTVSPGKTVTALLSPDLFTSHLGLYSIGEMGQIVSAFWEPELGW
jgi:hypothetical protein